MFSGVSVTGKTVVTMAVQDSYWNQGASTAREIVTFEYARDQLREC